MCGVTLDEEGRSNRRRRDIVSCVIHPRRLGGMVMFKRAKKDSGSSQPAKIGAAATGVGGLLGALLFWRKRKH
jgi:hypothetical protein